MDERSSYGLYITGDIEIYQCHVIKSNDLLPSVEKCPMDVYQRVVFTAQI